jgi:hypothetical protein
MKKANKKAIQMPLIRSVSYDSFFLHMLEVWRLKEKDIELLIKKDLPWLMDPHYIRQISVPNEIIVGDLV